MPVTPSRQDTRYAVFLADLAATFGALRVYVTHNEWYCKQDASLCSFRAAPLIDTEALLTDALLASFTALPDTEDGVIEHVVPLGEVPQLNEPTLALSLAATRFDGVPPTCPDLALSSETVQATRGYLLTVADRDDTDLLRFIFRASEAGKRAGGYQRIDFRSKARTDSAV